MNVREHYVEYQDEKNKVASVTRPTLNAVWKSKIDAEAPIGSDDSAYIAPLQAFYDKVYTPATLKPTLQDVETFMQTPDAKSTGVDAASLKRMIVSGFHIDVLKAAQETKKDEMDKAMKDIESGVLEPKNGVDEVRTRTEGSYVPADSRPGELPEGVYEPPVQQERPRHPGEYNDMSASWSGTQYYGVCDCAKNVL